MSEIDELRGVEIMSDLFERLVAGPDSTTEHTLRDGTKFKSRSGTRSQRNLIERKYSDNGKLFDAIAWNLWFQLANEDGTRAADGNEDEFKKFEKSLDYDLAVEMASKIRGTSVDGKDPEEEATFDEKVEGNIKNSKPQKEDT